MARTFLAAIVVGAIFSVAQIGQTADDERPNVTLFEWERGVALRRLDDPGRMAHLWFYEWNMFEAVAPGQHTGGTYKLERKVADDGRTARIDSPHLQLRLTAARDAVDLELTAVNRSDHEWPEIAAIIPCFNPGPREARDEQFVNDKTYFLAADALVQLAKREIHFNDRFRRAVDAEARDGRYVWSDKWPLAEPNAAAGLLLRESSDGRWVTGIAWEDFLSAQGHNPWDCMHLSVRVGPLKPGESKRIRGRMYLFPGDKQKLLERFQADFGKKK